VKIALRTFAVGVDPKGFLVIPAKAGIQEPVVTKHNLRGDRTDYWIPAFAGMTEVGYGNLGALASWRLGDSFKKNAGTAVGLADN
jgi:hypothetical protein